MNMHDNQLEQRIKDSLEQRSLTPQRDLWAEIAVQTANQRTDSGLGKWWLAAACLLLFGLGVLFLNREREPEIRVVTKTISAPDTKLQASQQVIATEQLSSKEPGVHENKPLLPATEPTQTPPQALAEKTRKPDLKDHLAPVLPEAVKTPKVLIATADSAQHKPKRKKYVDASTLLFSVEHKDVIEKTKDGSNVATIDLNTK